MANQNVNITIKAFDKTSRAFGTATRGIKAIAGAAFNLKTALIGTAGVAGMGLLVKSSLDATDSLGKTARKIGVTTEALASMRYAAELTGVATATMDMALQRFTRRAAEAAMGTGEAKGALKELRLDAAQLIKMPLDKQMQELAGAFAEVETDADRVRLAMKLFDSEGVALVNTLGLGKEALIEMAAEADRLGIALSADAVKGVEDANNAFTRLRALFKGVTDQTVASLAPALESLATTLKEKVLTAIEATDGGVEQFARNLAVNILEAVRSAVTGIATLVNSIGNAVTKIQNIINGFKSQSAAGDLQFLNRELAFFQSAYKTLQSGGGLSFADSLLLGTKGVANDVDAVGQAIMDTIYKIHVAEESIGAEPKVWQDILNLTGFNATIDEMIAGLGKVSKPPPPPVPTEEDTRSALQKNFDALKKKGADEIKFAEMTSDEKVKHVSGGLQKQFALAGKNSKKMFALSKAAGIADALVSTYQGAAKSMGAYPFPINVAMAAASVAAGMAQVSAIKSQSFDGGGFTGSGSRSGGVDGKGGFHAILHPQETVIDHTKPQKDLQQKINMVSHVPNMSKKLPSFEGGGYTGGVMPNNSVTNNIDNSTNASRSFSSSFEKINNDNRNLSSSFEKINNDNRNLSSSDAITNNDNRSTQNIENNEQQVIVNQTINVTTGVQSTVRAEIANLMPQISEAAQNAVLEARMRGGQYSKQLVGR